MNVLILRPDNIGDVVLFSGAVQHIRNLYPDAHITLAVQAHILNLVELCPYVDDCVAIEQLTWLDKPEHAEIPLKFTLGYSISRRCNILLNVVARPFHTIIYPVKSPQFYHLDTIYCLNPKQSFGIYGCNLNAFGRIFPPELQQNRLFTNHLDVSDTDPWAHEFLTTFKFLSFMGSHVATVEDIKPQFWLSDSEKNYLDGVKRNGRKIIGLFPGASFEGRCWKASNYGELARLLGGRPIYAIFGGFADMNLADKVALSIREHNEGAEIMNLAGQTTLRELVRTISCCDLFISMETSGLHMAIAANVPTIGVVGGGHFGRFVPWGNPSKHLFMTQKMECFHCKWQCSKNEVECVKGVSPFEVAIAAEKFLKSEVEP